MRHARRRGQVDNIRAWAQNREYKLGRLRRPH